MVIWRGGACNHHPVSFLVVLRDWADRVISSIKSICSGITGVFAVIFLIFPINNIVVRF